MQQALVAGRQAPALAGQPLRAPARATRPGQLCRAAQPAAFVLDKKAAAESPKTPPSRYDSIPVGGDLPADYDRDTPSWNKRRRAGVILHPTSLPGPNGIGELGLEARLFVDWLASAGMQCWQMLPMVPPDPMFYSPYSGTDSNSGNLLLLSIDDLIADGLLEASDAPTPVPVADCDFPAVDAVKAPILKKAAQRLLSAPNAAKLREEMAAWR
jgi:4-alpha-glucanotransferase